MGKEGRGKKKGEKFAAAGKKISAESSNWALKFPRRLSHLTHFSTTSSLGYLIIFFHKLARLKEGEQAAYCVQEGAVGG